MIQLYSRLSLPLRGAKYRAIVDYEKLITENKAVCFAISHDAEDLFIAGLDLKWAGIDHAGVGLTICLFGLTIFLRIQDRRHWNYELNRWEPYEVDSEKS